MRGMNDLMRQAQVMQKKLLESQKALDQKHVEATSGGGMVSAVVTGALDLVSIKIDKSVVDPDDVDMLQDLIMAAVNEAVKKAKAMKEEEMAKLTGGMNIPGLF